MCQAASLSPCSVVWLKAMEGNLIASLTLEPPQVQSSRCQQEVCVPPSEASGRGAVVLFREGYEPQCRSHPPEIPGQEITRRLMAWHWQSPPCPAVVRDRGQDGSPLPMTAEVQFLDVYRPMYTHRLYAHTIQSMHIPRNSTGVFARTCKHGRLLVKYYCVDTCRVFRKACGIAS